MTYADYSQIDRCCSLCTNDVQAFTPIIDGEVVTLYKRCMRLFNRAPAAWGIRDFVHHVLTGVEPCTS